MKKLSLALVLSLIASACSAQDNPPQIADDAIFTAAGFTKQADGTWHKCDDPGTPSYTQGVIERPGDLNGDGMPEFVVTEGGTYCYGFTGQGYTLVSSEADGGLRVMAEGIGMALFLETKGKDGWPDLEVGGPGFCFPVLRWNGKEYAFHRNEYEGKACQP